MCNHFLRLFLTFISVPAAALAQARDCPLHCLEWPSLREMVSMLQPGFQGLQWLTPCLLLQSHLSYQTLPLNSLKITKCPTFSPTTLSLHMYPGPITLFLSQDLNWHYLKKKKIYIWKTPFDNPKTEWCFIKLFIMLAYQVINIFISNLPLWPAVPRLGALISQQPCMISLIFQVLPVLMLTRVPDTCCSTVKAARFQTVTWPHNSSNRMDFLT